ncbi:D-Ala-D-Ala carboxypeptidase family metallohydrolase [Phenylobacterium sp.]|uniref:D-Ala-D-Ala carboxypeptidase family metallohydrolase n=1 Tax=Phenylobacterium sp. TaxID=1871053 RepID=UPI002730D5B6|nr:D-Ala-D-Ala carboxypeptidase family metallohydrolase [Phenylobacterium sp.]MDP1873625.1 D-Ala-D-Ala carboxypeptidase family metallohydrolase [Phenylobacterium sp.]
MKLSANFHLDEFVTSQTAARRGIDNTPPAPVLIRLKNTAKGLEKVRAVLGKPILISSGYRSPALNKAVGGSATSDHMNGDAADFISPGFGTPIAICRAIVAAGIKFDQLIEEGTWVHISFGPRMRGQILTMRNGKYTAGLR